MNSDLHPPTPAPMLELGIEGNLGICQLSKDGGVCLHVLGRDCSACAWQKASGIACTLWRMLAVRSSTTGSAGTVQRSCRVMMIGAENMQLPYRHGHVLLCPCLVDTF